MQFSKWNWAHFLCFDWFAVIHVEIVQQSRREGFEDKEESYKIYFYGSFLGISSNRLSFENRNIKTIERACIQQVSEGLQPNDADSVEIIPRPQVMRQIKEMFLPQQVESHTHFGVILGPSGSGKTYAVHKVCNEYPHGILYYEIKLPEGFIDGLSREVGMKIT